MSYNKQTFVYQRKKHKRNCNAVCPMQGFDDTKPSNGCQSSVSLKAPPMAAEEHMSSEFELAEEDVKLPSLLPVECIITRTAESFNGCHVQVETSSEEVLKSDVQRVWNNCSDNDNYSSSKSNLEVCSSFFKTDVSNLGEYSSDALNAGKFLADVSEKSILISILKSQRYFEKDWTRWDRVSDKDTAITNSNCCLKTCRVCEHVETVHNMLICDNCEDAFHITCCNPPIKRIPVNEWLCDSCSKMKHKLLETSQIGRDGFSASEGKLGRMEFMFSGTGSHMSKVRIGNGFQANVPDWSGPLDSASDLVGEPIKADSLKNVSTRACNATKHMMLGSVGNWLQCQEVIDAIGGEDGAICGKWRRAPLFEVQTDDWECFHCVLWDPTHADCSVPQELDTEEVMKQLKYIEMLKPHLGAKRRK